MMQPSDKELDKLISDASEHFEATGADPNWEGMKLLLEEQQPLKKEISKRPFVLMMLFVLLLGGGMIYFINTGNKIPLPAKKIDKPVSVVQDKTGNTKPGNVEDVQGAKQKTNSLSSIRSVNTGENNQNTKTNLLKNRKAGYSKHINSGGGTGEINHISENDHVAKEINTSPDARPASGEPIVNNDAPEIPGAEAAKSTVKTGTNQNNETAGTGNIATVKKNKKIQTNRHPLEISLVYAPELTTIKLSNFDKPGSNYGILLGYDILKNTSIQTGMITSRKYYTANGNDFKTNYVATPPYKLSSVKGYCNMYEIPLNVKYRISNNKKINTFIIAGVSSYFMTNEFYEYQYTSYNNAYSWSKKYDSQKNYWFSLATMGIGFEKEISKKINVAANPFMKIPFKGMGTGDLKLLSAGVNFSISYRPSFTRQPK